MAQCRISLQNVSVIKTSQATNHDISKEVVHYADI